ncbi:MAG: DnaJ domain-containing protein [Firmicutes bacterium]|nr:DnaJ domain-containing protein [Bacillota bacterium]
MDDLRRYYQVLQVSPGASRSTIRAAYRRLAKQYHPDRGGSPGQMVLLNEAYSVLMRSETPLPHEDSSHVTGQPVEESTSADGPIKSRRVQSWVRLGARAIDTLFEFLVGLLSLYLAFSLLLPEGLHQDTARLLLAHSPLRLLGLYLLLWSYLVTAAILLESLLLSAWGSTPGRRLLNTEIFDLIQSRTTFGRALRRSLSVWACGLGLGLPVLTPFTLLASYRRLTRRGATRWDEAGGFFVVCPGLKACRVLASILVLLLLLSALHLLSGYLQGLWW